MGLPCQPNNISHASDISYVAAAQYLMILCLVAVTFDKAAGLLYEIPGIYPRVCSPGGGGEGKSVPSDLS